MLLVNLLAALKFANVFLNKKRLENKKTFKNVKLFLHLWRKWHTSYTVVLEVTLTYTAVTLSVVLMC